MASRQFSNPFCGVSSCGQDAIGGRVRSVADRCVVELVAGEAARVRLDFGCPIGDRHLVEHVLRRRMVVDADLVTKSAAEQRGRRHVEDLPREIPQRHFDAAHGAHQIVRRAVGASTAQAGRALAHPCVQRIDLERILAHQPRLQREHLLFHTDAWRSIRLGDAVVTRLRRDLGERRCLTLQHHHPKVPDLCVSSAQPQWSTNGRRRPRMADGGPRRNCRREQSWNGINARASWLIVFWRRLTRGRRRGGRGKSPVDGSQPSSE